MISSLPWINKKCTVAVVGDIILDEYLEGSVQRISPEAPVPIHVVQKNSYALGGAANVAANIKLCEAEVLLFSVWGKDDTQKTLKKELQKISIPTDYIVESKDRPTIRKTRVTANHHQLIRIDWEKVSPITQTIQDKIIQNLKETNFDVLLISDYGKGTMEDDFVRALIQVAQQKKVPSIVDPKGFNYEKYRGCTLITPNRKEALESLGLTNEDATTPEEIILAMQKKFQFENILITLGSQGMIGLSSELHGDYPGPTFFIPAVAREVYDVSGAGDTVAAVMALCFATQTPFFEAMTLSNIAAGKVVEKWGTQPITRTELEEEIQKHHLSEKTDFTILQNSSYKITSVEQLQAIIGKHFGRKKKIVFTNGCFDVLHFGHVNYLEKAKSLGNILIVGINSDASIKKIKGPSRPVNTLKNRMGVLAGLQCVDYVVSFEEETPLALIQSLEPNVLVKGADWEKNKIVGSSFVESYGGQIATIPFVDGLSSTKIIEQLKV